VDGLDITGDDLEQWLAKSTDDFECAEFQSCSAELLVVDALDQAITVLNDTDSKRAEVVDSLSQGNTQQASEGLAECFSQWHQVHTAIAHSVGILGLDVQEMQVNGVPMEKTLTEITDLLGQIKEVLKADDQVLLSDLLQYEFDRVTDAWKGVIEAIKTRAANPSAA